MRMQPFSSAHLAAMVAALVSAAALTSWTEILRMAVLTALCFAISTGARKDEWTASFKGDTYMRRSNFTWVDEDERDLPSTPSVISSRKNGNLLRARSAPSKCDRLNIDWGGRDMWFRYDDTCPLNFAWRWRQWEEAHPCPMHERHRWPAFSPTGDEMPFTGGKAESCLNALMDAAMSTADALVRSWHSARITIATRLFARRGQVNGIARDDVEGVIQSLVRWKTPEAMRLYTRTRPNHYADYVDMVTDLSVSSDGVMPDDLCEVDPRGVYAETMDTIEAIDAETAKTKKATQRAQRNAAEATAGTKSNKQGKRRSAPATGGVSANAAEPEAKRRTYEIGDGQTVHHAGDDSWGIIGQPVKMHNSFWGWPTSSTPSKDDYSDCRVVAYIGAHRFEGKVSKHTYVIECEGHHYAAPHATVAGHLDDAAVKRRVRKAKPPRLL